MGFEDDDVVYGVIVSTDDNTDYAMRHVENIWKQRSLHGVWELLQIAMDVRFHLSIISLWLERQSKM